MATFSAQNISWVTEKLEAAEFCSMYSKTVPKETSYQKCPERKLGKKQY
jgi:hypothetical protein